jgi:protease IV
VSNSPHTAEDNMVNALLKDRRRDRRWKIIRSFMWAFIVLLYALLIFRPSSSDSSSSNINKPYVSLIRMQGIIMPGRPFSALKLIPQLKHAFADKKSKGVILVVNSPGGSPVQASIIHDKIEQLKKLYNKKVVVIGQDSLASGAYLVATAADKIYVHNDTLTGSIGVIMSGFGFSDAIKKLGVTRRVFTAGENKNRLDSFKPLTPTDTAKVKTLLNEVHQHFIDNVVKGRGNRLKGDRHEMFSGDFWEGSTAVKLGLADGVGNTWDVMKKEFNVKVYRNYSAKPTLLHMVLGNIEAQLHTTLSQQSHAELTEQLQ